MDLVCYKACEAGRQHKAWGGAERNPRTTTAKTSRARRAGDSESPGQQSRYCFVEFMRMGHKIVRRIIGWYSTVGRFADSLIYS